MKKKSYILLIAAVGIMSTACEEKKDVIEMGKLDGIGMVVRSVSVADGSTITPIDGVTVDYNNLVGINHNLPVTVNGNAVNAYVNPENGMQLVIPIFCEWNTSYSVVVPDGAIYRSDDATVTNEGLSVSFNTNIGMNPSKVEKNLTNNNATAEAKALYQEMLDNYGKYMYSGAMGGVGWETGYTDYIAANNSGAGYPKVVGFDYIHLAYSPSNWIDYSDITPVKSVWEKGSIPAITWHWNVPEITTGGNLYPFNETSEAVVMPGDWSGNLQIPASYFSLAKEGNVVTVNVSDVADNAQGSFKNGSTWGGIVDGDVNYDYFDLKTADEEGNYGEVAYFTLTLTPSVLAEVKENGLIISGHDYTLQSVAFDGYIQKGDMLSYNNSFSPLAVLNPETPQHAVAEADIAKLAGYLKLLQDANIPLLFRPFHEAAGDYTWGSWFWWGKDGVEATKQLWYYLRDKLENEYGLNNLIWVWTVQTYSEGHLTQDISLLRSAYPGDNSVDMVGADLYPEDVLSDQSDIFYVVNAMVDGKKIVAACEIGNLIDPVAAITNNALWSYFMNWYDYQSEGVFGFHDWNTPAVTVDGIDYPNVWSAVANSPYVVNQ